jgi:hypothetical protein
VRLSLCSLAVFLALGGAIAAAQAPAAKSQYPIFTTDHLNEAMRTVGLAYGLASTSIAKDDRENAKDYLIRARDQLATTITFWRDRKVDDAVTILRDTLKKMDDLDAAMSAETVDTAAVKKLAGEITAGCESCHAKYREQDPTTKAYRVKSDVAR